MIYGTFMRESGTPSDVASEKMRIANLSPTSSEDAPEQPRQSL